MKSHTTEVVSRVLLFVLVTLFVFLVLPGLTHVVLPLGSGVREVDISVGPAVILWLLLMYFLSLFLVVSGFIHYRNHNEKFWIDDWVSEV